MVMNLMEDLMSEHTTLNDLDTPALREAAKYFGTDLTGIKGKLNIVQALEDDGIDITMYNQWQARIAAEAPEPEVNDAGTFEPAKPELAEAGPSVVIKMERANPEYDTFGVTFTREHPFAIVDQATAELILENEEGFRIALQKELENYYS
jgi:hypothetical protein